MGSKSKASEGLLEQLGKSLATEGDALAAQFKVRTSSAQLLRRSN